MSRREANLRMLEDLLSAADHFAVVATGRPDGSVHASLVKAGVLDDPASGRRVAGLVVVQGDSRKLEHLRRSGRAAVVVQRGYRWACAEGPARLYGPDDPVGGLDADRVVQLLRDVFIAAGGTHDDWSEYDRVMAGQRAVAVTVDPWRVSGSG